MLVTVTGRVVRPYGEADVALPESGSVRFVPASDGTHEGALRTSRAVVAEIRLEQIQDPEWDHDEHPEGTPPPTVPAGVMEPVELAPGPWWVTVAPDYLTPWRRFLIELDPSTDPVDLATVAPVVVVDGEKWSRGVGVAGIRVADDGTYYVVVLTDGSETTPVPIPEGNTGRGIAHVSDPDAEGRVTITYTDDTTSQVQAIRGNDGRGIVSIEQAAPGTATVTYTDDTTATLVLPPGEDGHTPALRWQGTALIVDDQDPVDLRGETGHTPVPAWSGTSLSWDGGQAVDLKGNPGGTPPDPVITVSGTTTLAPGSSATVNMAGTYPNRALAFGIPRGDKGDPGAPGAVPTASSYLIVGPGRPDIAGNPLITGSEPNGCVYRSTDGVHGAWEWLKRPSGWVVTHADSGWRRFGTTTNGDWYIAARATTHSVHISARFNGTTTDPMPTLPVAWRPLYSDAQWPAQRGGVGTNGDGLRINGGQFSRIGTSPNVLWDFTFARNGGWIADVPGSVYP